MLKEQDSLTVNRGLSAPAIIAEEQETIMRKVSSGAAYANIVLFAFCPGSPCSWMSIISSVPWSLVTERGLD